MSQDDVKAIEFSIDGGGDFGQVTVTKESDPKTARAENAGRYRIEISSAKLTSAFWARQKSTTTYKQDLGTFTLAQRFDEGVVYWMAATGGGWTLDPFETGIVLGVGGADGSLLVNRHDYLILDNEEEFIENDDDENPIEADR